jgi:hypothetical protein
VNERARAERDLVRARAAVLKAARRVAKSLDARKPENGTRGRGRPPTRPGETFMQIVLAAVLRLWLDQLKAAGHSRDDGIAEIAGELCKSPKTVEDMLYVARRRRRVRKPRSVQTRKPGN